ncbi:MAG: iron ABC transporter permease [Candidatus Thorarchaeota archaeon]|nr:iron ABC transporter permease [Candidatus Thorarchaeota archaeon]
MNARTILNYAILSFPFLLLIVFLVFPVFFVNALYLFTGPSFFETIMSPSIRFILQFTIGQAILSTLMAVLIGLPGAFLIARLRFRGKSLVRAMMIVPFVLPPIVVVVGFLEMFGSYGVIDSILMWIQGSSTSVFNLATGIPGIILAHTFYNIPLVILMVSASLERLNPEIEESAEILGASSRQRLRYITLPHVMPSLLASAVLTFMFCFMSFPIVLAFGQGRFITIEAQIWNAFRLFDYGEASSLTLMQIVITLSLAFTYVRLTKRENETGKTASMKTTSFNRYPLRERVAIAAYLSLIVVLVLGPIATIARASVYDPVAKVYTLEGFTNLFRLGGQGAFRYLVNSLFYAGLATVFAVILGILLALDMRSHHRFVPTFASSMILLPLGISSITVAYGLVLAIAVPTGLITNPWPIIIIAQTIIGLPFSARAIELAMSKIDPALLEQADSLGASRIQRFLFVELPLLAPGILVGAVFAFAMAIGEMSATLFIALPQNYTLAVAIYEYLGVRAYVEAGASAFFLVIVCVIAFLTIERISEGSTGGAL